MEIVNHKGMRTLPGSWTDDVAKERIVKRVQSVLRAANNALKGLRNLASKSFVTNGKVPQKWTEYTITWLDENCDKRINTATSMPLTEGMLNRILSEWEDKRKEGKAWIRDLRQLKDLMLDGFEIKEEYGTHILRCSNLKEVAEKSSVMPVDKTCRELWRLIQNCREAYSKVNQFCKDNDLREFDPMQVMRLTEPKDFVTSYCIGTYNLHPSEAQNKARVSWIIKQQNPYGEGKSNLQIGNV